jgi:TonB family protein
MANRSAIAAAVLAGVIVLAALIVAPGNAAPTFRPATLKSAGDLIVPFNSVAVGAVELRATVGKEGDVKDVQVVHDLASVTDQAVDAVKSWQFNPAHLGPDPVATRVTLALFYCPYVGPTKLTLPGVSAAQPDDKTVSIPPEITSAQFPVDVNGRRTGGTVVLQVTVSPDGRPGLAKVVHGFEPMNDHSLAAVKDWQFAPASLQGQNVRSNIIIAFVFRNPMVSTPY